MIPERLEQARSFGCETIDLRKEALARDQIEQIVGVPEVDCAVDCVGFEARGHGHDAAVERPATVLNSLMEVTRAGGAHRHPRAVRDRRSRAESMQNAKIGVLGIRIGLGWAKSHTFATGQCPVIALQPPADAGDPLRQNPDREGGQRPDHLLWMRRRRGYKDFDKGAAKKFVIDPHKMVPAA